MRMSEQKVTHTRHAKRAGVATPCTAAHVNFGGGCLNCGWSPRMEVTKMLSGSQVRYINTLFGFVGEGELLCAPCGRAAGAFKKGNDLRPIHGVRDYNEGGSVEDEICDSCGSRFGDVAEND